MESPDPTASVVAVCDAGPIIHLDELGRLDLLAGFREVLIPSEVAAEVEQHRGEAPWKRLDARMLESVPAVESAVLSSLVTSLELDAGEVAAFRVALARDEPVIFLTDDLSARTAGKALGLEVHGTVGLVVRGLRLGRSFSEILSMLGEIPERSTLHLKKDLLDEVIQHIQGQQEDTRGIEPGSVDTDAEVDDRAVRLEELVRRIVEEWDFDPDDHLLREWIIRFFCYLIWWESSRASTRRQGDGGPARGLVQIEPRTLRDIFEYFVMGPRPGLVANLAEAAGVDEEEMREAIEAFLGGDSPDEAGEAARNRWPEGEPAEKIERWLLTVDTFAIKLLRYGFARHGRHRFPPDDEDLDIDVDEDPSADEFKRAHAEQWAEWWKGAFPGEDEEAREEERERLIEEFIERARDFDRGVP